MDAGLRISFVVGVLTSLGLMKFFSLRNLPKPKKSEILKFAFSPLFSFSSWTKSKAATPNDLAPLFLRTIKYSFLLVMAYAVYWHIVRIFPSPTFPVCYFAIFPVLLLGEALGPLLQILFYPLGKIIPSHHCCPLASKSVSDFWGKRWNTWLSDWFRDVLFRPFRKRPAFGTLVVFIFSGLWHELVINVPAISLYGLNFLGSMVIYFLIQWVGLSIDRQFFYNSNVLRRIFTWLIVIGPCPLILNEATLRIANLWP